MENKRSVNEKRERERERQLGAVIKKLTQRYGTRDSRKKRDRGEGMDLMQIGLP